MNGYKTIDAICIEEKSYFLGENPRAEDPFAVWEVGSGHPHLLCYSDRTVAVQDFCRRVYNWTRLRQRIENRDYHKNHWMLNTRMEITQLTSMRPSLREFLFLAGIRTLGELMKLSDEELSMYKGIRQKRLELIKAGIYQEVLAAKALTALLENQGYTTPQGVIEMTNEQILNCYDINHEQIGRILSFQRDMGGKHYDENDIFYVAGDKVYCCTNCRYRSPDANFCGWCTMKILDEMKEKKRK